MATANCTLNGYSCFNNGWGGTASSPYTDNSASHPCWGIDGNGNYRWMVLSFTTPDMVGIDQSISFTMKVYNGAKNPTVKYMLATQGANYSGTDGGSKAATVPTDVLTSGTVSLTMAASTYTTVTFTIDADGLEANTTYYLWTTTEGYSYTGYCGYYSGTPWAAVVEYTPNVAYIHNGSDWVSAVPYIHNGSERVQATPYIHNGSDWVVTQ